MFRLRVPEWVGTALFLTLAIGVAYVMWALVSQNGELKDEIARLRTQSSILGASMQPGDQMPPVSLSDLAGRAAALTDLVPDGGVIVFLTTTCPFCKETLPAWNRLAGAYAASDVPFVGISLDDPERTRAYADSMRVAWPHWIAEEPLAASAELKVPLVPLTVLVGRTNAVERVWHGALTDADVRALLQLLEDRVLNTSISSGSYGEDPGCCEAPAVGTTVGS